MSNKIEVGISANDAGFTSTIKKVNQSTQTMDDTVKKVAGNVASSFGSMVKAGAGLAVGFGAIKLAGAAIREVFQGFGEALDLGGELSDLSARTGETAGNLTVLQRAFDNTGSSADKVGPSINKMQKFLDDAAQGTQLNIETMDRLGVSLSDLKGKTPTEQMQILAERLSAIQDPTERGALAMKLFGKSGGELLPLLRNFSGELETARGELGSLPGVMDQSNGSFDTISDNLTKLKTKFRDLAAGLLDRLSPALEFATTMLTRLDAAAIGMKIGDILIGAGSGMQGFKAALEALSFGDFSEAWDIALTSIKLTMAESINSIFANIKGLFAAIKTLINESGITVAIEALTMGVANKISSALRGVISEFLNSIGKVEAAKEMMLLSKADEDRAQNYFQIAKAGFISLGDNISDAMGPMKTAYDDAVSSAGKLIDTSKMSVDLAFKIAELEQKRAAAIKDQGLASEKFDTNRKANQEAYKNTLDIIKQIEQEIKDAKSSGDKEAVKGLEKKLAFEKEIAAALKDGKSLQEAIKQASDKRAQAEQAITDSLKEQTNEMAKQVNFSKDMLDAINQRKQEEEIDPKGKMRDKFAEAEAKGNIGGMERARNKMLQKEEEAHLDKAFHDVTGKDNRAAKKSVRDMARELGLDTTGKSNKEIRDEIKKDLDKKKQEKDLRDAMKKDLDEKQKGKDDPNKKGEKEAPKDGKNDTLSKISSAVDAIKTSILSLEKKLPQPALGY